VQDLHPDGLETTQQRPLLHDGLPAGGVHAARHALDRGQRVRQRPAPALPRAAAGPARGPQPVRSVGPGVDVAEGPILHGRTLSVERGRVGISYSGGGALLLVELGIALAFVDLGIRPYAIAGVSAGAITAAAHAIDPIEGRGILAAAKGLELVDNH